MMAPPGTPGAATIMTPSIIMKPRNIQKSNGIPFIIINATAQAVILRQLPERWIVAQRGTVNPAISSLTPFLRVQSKVTGIVAADEEVPRAVKYAGSILPSSLNGLRLTIPPARQYWNTSRRIWRAKITPIMDMNTLITCMACPVWVMLRNMPKMYTGSNGMITTSMALTIMSLNSDARFFSPLEPKNAIPNPSRKANTRADITSTIGGMLMVKYGSRFSNPSATS